MVSSVQDVPALRVSATARELERIRAKRRLLEAGAKTPVTPPSVTLPETVTPVAASPASDPAYRNAKIKSNARKLLDQLQIADTSLGDASHSLKILFAKQALRALSERQAAASAEAEQRKLEKLKEHLEEEHHRQQLQQQQHQQQQALRAQLQAQQQATQQAQLQAQLQAQKSAEHAAVRRAVQQQTLQELGLGREQQHHRQLQLHPRRRRSRSAGDRNRRPSPRRVPSPEPRSGEEHEYDSHVGSFNDSDAHRSDAAHVRDTRRSSSRSRTQRHGQHLRNQLAGPTEAGVRGAVSAQALSALLAGLQLHGVNLTSGPPPSTPPAPPAAAAAVQTDPSGEAGGGVGGGRNRRRSAGDANGSGGRSGGGGARPGEAEEPQQQYVLLPDGTVGLVHTVVKPAVLSPQLPPGTVSATAAPHALPLVLLQPGGGGGGAAAAGVPPLHWPGLSTGMDPAATLRGYPYGSTLLLPYFSPPHPPYPSAPYGYLPSPYLGGTASPPLSPSDAYPHSPGGPPQVSSGAPSGMPLLPPFSPPYGQPPYGPDSYYYRHHGPLAPTPPPPPFPHDGQLRSYQQYRPDITSPPPHPPHTPPPQPNQSSPTAHPIANDADGRTNLIRNSLSSLSSEPYGNLPGTGAGDDSAGGGGGHRGGDRSHLSPSATAPGGAGSPGGGGGTAPSAGSIGGPGPSPTETAPGNVQGGSAGFSGGRYHHRHSHSGAESLRSVPSNSGGSLRGVVTAGSASVSASQQYEATLASPSPRDSLQGLDSPASFRDMPRRASGSVSLSPLSGANINSSLDSTAAASAGPSGGGSSSRRGPSPLYSSSGPDSAVAAAAAERVGVPFASSGSSSAASVVLRATSSVQPASLPAPLPPGVSPFAGVDPAAQAGLAGGGGGGGGGGSGLTAGESLPSVEEPSLLLRTLDIGSPLQRSKVSDDLPETPTSRKPSLTSPWGSSALGPSNANTEPGGGAAAGGMAGGGTGGGYSSTRDILMDVVSRPPIYGTTLPYGTAGLYERYASSGLYGMPGTGYTSTAGVLGGGGAGGGGSAAGAQRSPSSDSLRSVVGGGGSRAYGPPGGDMPYGSAALALTAAILESSGAAATMSASTPGLSAAAVQGMNQMGWGHLHPSSAPTSPPGGSNPATGPASLARTSSINNRSPPGSESGGLGAAGVATGAGGGGGGGGLQPSMAFTANAAVMARLSHVSNPDGTFSPRTRSRIQLMGNDELAEVLSPRSTNASGHNLTNPPQQHHQQLVPVLSSSRLSASNLNAHQQQLAAQQQYQQQGPYSTASPQSPSRLASRSPTGDSGIQPTVPTLRLPQRVTSRNLSAAVAAPTTGAASGPSSGHGSPTRLDHPGLDPRDAREYDMDQSMSARSGRSGASDGTGGGGAGAVQSASSGERVYSVPVVEHRDIGNDAAAVYGMGVSGMGADLISGGGGIVGMPGAASAAGPPPGPSSQQQQQLPMLLDLIGNTSMFATASPSGSAGLSPLGFGGSSTPLERSADSFVRIGSMPFSGAASPIMAPVQPIELLGSPTKAAGQGGSGGRGSSGGASSAGGGGAFTPLSTGASIVPGGGGVASTGSMLHGSAPPSPPRPPQLGGSSSFRTGSSGPSGGPTGTTGAGTGPSTASPLTSPPPLPPPGVLGRAVSMGATAAAAGLAGNSSKVLSPGGNRSIRPPSPGAIVPPAPAMAAAPGQRPSGLPTAGTGGAGGSSKATAILTRVLSGRGEFDSDDDDDAVELPYTSTVGRGPGGGGGLARATSTVGASGMITSPGKPMAGGGRGTLASAGAHDDEFNF